jgi:hypothetical protein
MRGPALVLWNADAGMKAFIDVVKVISDEREQPRRFIKIDSSL